MSTDPVAVVGAGPAGLSAAAKLAEAGVPVEVFEASPHVGGLARSLPLWGQIVDLGPHRFFSNNPLINEHWRSFVGEDYTRVDRLTRILYKGQFYQYPLRPWNTVRNLGPVDLTRSMWSYARQRLRPIDDPKTFEEWVTNRFGRRLFEIFFKTYSEKVWGIPCSRIDADWAAQRIKKLSFVEAAKSAFVGNKKGHATLVDQFLYPNGGSGTVYEKMVRFVEERGGHVHLSTPVREVTREPGGRANGLVLADGRPVRASHVVSTMPLTLMVRALKGVPDDVVRATQQLRFRNTILVYVEVEGDDLFPDQWLYIHSPEVKHGRITNFRNWSTSLHGESRNTILCMEFWCFDDDDIWKQTDDALGQLARTELRTVGVVPTSRRTLRTHVVRLSRSYPVYETGYMRHLEVVQRYVNSIPGILAIGRYGAFKYNNQDHSILMGLLAAKEIVTGQPQGLWDVNTDDEYQEKGKAQ